MMAKYRNDDFLHAPESMQNPVAIVGTEHFGAINQGVNINIVF